MRSVVLLLLVVGSASAAASHPTFVAVIDGTPVLAKSGMINIFIFFKCRLIISIFPDTARCFSCMSKLYEGVWPLLKHVYKPPKNFTGFALPYYIQ